MSATSNRRVAAISAGSLAVLLGALDTYVVVAIVTDMMKVPPEGVGIPVNKPQLIAPIITWYLLGYIAAMPLLGRASDRFGRKLVLQVSLAVFALGSVWTALATDLMHLVIGRTIQGVSAGALLPVTLALAADLWAARNRAGVLGTVSSAQELGSVLGPLYGVGVVLLIPSAVGTEWLTGWHAVFWINVPLSIIAMVMIHFSLPAHSDSEDPQKVDVVGGVLLALTLALVTLGLDNQNPDGKHVLPPNGAVLLICAVVAAVAFAVWEIKANTRIIDPQGVRFRPFLAGLGASLCTGAALMVTLVNGELFLRVLLGLDKVAAIIKLSWFFAALPIGALLGGWVATKLGDRIVAFVGLLIAGGGYLLFTDWDSNVLTARHDLVLFSLPSLDTDLAIAGFGLGLVIAPLTSATLRVVPTVQHGIASAGVVVSRMIGMLIGMAALTAFGMYTFTQKMAELPRGNGNSLAEAAAQLAKNAQTAYAAQYSATFKITAIVCVVGALLGLLIAGRDEHADEPEPAVEVDPDPAPVA
ncbi:MFS family permease [Mycobacterium sp. MAA66]|uniref:MFS transporter n=1 Tax=Mycobacterium sp. MAA66 TaxID=3156297 RepID=UPI0035138687